MRENAANVYEISGHPTFKGTMHEMKLEFADFVNTRLAMLKTELRQKKSIFQLALPMAAAAIVMGLCAFVFLNVAIVAVLANAFGSTIIAWCYGALIMFGFYAIVGSVAGMMAYREIREVGIMPVHTMKVLKQDTQWMQREARTQL